MSREAASLRISKTIGRFGEKPVEGEIQEDVCGEKGAVKKEDRCQGQQVAKRSRRDVMLAEMSVKAEFAFDVCCEGYRGAREALEEKLIMCLCRFENAHISGRRARRDKRGTHRMAA